LHVLYGVSVEPPKRFVRPVHPFARARVYDLRRYTASNLWGPFLDDGSEGVDWEKVEAIMVVLGYNLRVFCERMSGRVGPFWDEAWVGTTEGSFVSPPRISEEPALPLEAQDPYGVTGTWMRVSGQHYPPSISHRSNKLPDRLLPRYTSIPYLLPVQL